MALPHDKDQRNIVRNDKLLNPAQEKLEACQGVFEGF
jgi:hypothetical protein